MLWARGPGGPPVSHPEQEFVQVSIFQWYGSPAGIPSLPLCQRSILARPEDRLIARRRSGSPQHKERYKNRSRGALINRQGDPAKDMSFDAQDLGNHLTMNLSSRPSPRHGSPETAEISRRHPNQPPAQVQAVRQHAEEYPGLERWILAKELGRGTFGKVYHAKDSTGQMPDVAIKVVFKSKKDLSQVCMERLRRSR